MGKLKGKKKLNKAVSAQLAPFGISKAKLSDLFSYDYETEEVTYKLTSDIGDKFFSEFVFERFGFDCRGLEMIISLLHEVGHHLANDEITGLIYDFCQSEKNRIETELADIEEEEEMKKFEWEYFNLPDEILATAWAVKYATEHPTEVQLMNAVIMEKIAKFYTKNGVTED